MITGKELEKIGFESVTDPDLFETAAFYWLDKLLGVVLDKEKGTARIVGGKEEVDNMKDLLEWCQTECLDHIKELKETRALINEKIDSITDIMFKITDAHRSLE